MLSDKSRAIWRGYQIRPGFFCAALRDAAATKPNGALRDISHARTGETPYVQRHHFGAVVAFHWRIWGISHFRPCPWRKWKIGQYRRGVLLVLPRFFCFGESWDLHALRTLGRLGTRPNAATTASQSRNPAIRAPSPALKIGKAERELGPLLWPQRMNA